MENNKIGQIVEISEGYTIETLGGKSLQVKKGDQGFIDARGCIHYTTGAATGKIQAIKDCKPKGYAHESIARLLFDHIDQRYDLKSVLEEYDVDEAEFVSDIEDKLTEIL